MPRLAHAPAAALAAVALAAGPGCASVLGLDDPVATHPFDGAVDGHYVLSVNEGGAITRLIAGVIADEADRTIELTLTPLVQNASQSNQVAGDTHTFADVPVANLAQRDFELDDVTIDLPGAAVPDGQPTRIVSLSIKGRFPLIEGRSTDDAFCGDLNGTVSVPVERPFQGTFAAVKIELGAALPSTVKASCDQLP